MKRERPRGVMVESMFQLLVSYPIALAHVFRWMVQTNPPFPLQLFHGAQNAKAKVPSVPYGGSLFHSTAAPASALAAIAQREAPLTGWMWETLPFLSTTIWGWFIPPTKKDDLENLGTTKQSCEDGSKPPKSCSHQVIAGIDGCLSQKNCIYGYLHIYIYRYWSIVVLKFLGCQNCLYPAQPKSAAMTDWDEIDHEYLSHKSGCLTSKHDKS